MGRFRTALFAGTGFAAALLIWAAAAVGDVHSATYTKGSKICLMCHKGRNADIAASYPKTAHANAFWKVGEEKEGEKIVGDFAKAPGFKQDQVVYVLGVGSNSQAYLDKDLKVLPGRWDVAGKTWATIPSVDATTQCVACHVTGYDEAAKTWTEPGVACESCHGPGSEHMTASDKKAAIVRPQTLPPLREAMVCGHCHSVGTNKAGNRPYCTTYRPGDDLSATFTDSKPATHSTWPRWNQYSEWLQSKHAAANPPTTCTKCHEPHGTTGNANQLRKAGNALCLDCHKTLTGSQHSAENLAKTTCVMCHMAQGNHFFRKPGA